MFLMGSPNVSQVSEEKFTRGAVVGARDGAKFLAGIAGELRPLAAGGVRDRDQRLPHVGFTVLDWEVGFGERETVSDIGHPVRE